jgi:hypothetical protein
MPGVITSNSAWNLYGRVGPWADCRKFTPPRGTAGLCEPKPPAQRHYVAAGSATATHRDKHYRYRPSEYYVYGPEAPAYRMFGPAFFVSKNPHATALLRKWSSAAILGQPLGYLHAVWLDTIRLFDPNQRSYGDLSASELIAWMLGGFPANSGKNELVEVWQKRLYPHDPLPHRGDIGPLKAWERITRVQGVWMGILLALCLAGPALLAGRARSGMILFALSAMTLLFLPIFDKGYDYRFVIPAFAPLLAAGALATWGLVARIRARTEPASQRAESGHLPARAAHLPERSFGAGAPSS